MLGYTVIVNKLRSYVYGEWVQGDDRFAELKNPTTETTIAQASTAGIDMDRALRHSREVGGPALRALTFAERGALLAAMSRTIHGAREELIELAIENGGNTRGDAKFDLDGATGTLMAYADLGAELGDRRTLVDGDPVDLGGGSRLGGYHIRIPRPGVAVHIGAFNFPAWGWAEKAACALLAGMPVLTKPATATSLVAARTVELVVEAKILPQGALSALVGSAGDVLQQLSFHDVVAFTGGSATARTIRGTERLLDAGVRVNVEADSLNAAVLAPDADDATVDVFLRHVHRDITQKAGQKCTAIRRILVPEAAYDRVAEALSERLGDTVIGDPKLADVRMGPLATARQRDDFNAGVAKLREQTDIIYGDPATVTPTGVDDGRGYFVPALLLGAKSALDASVVHELEVFGPCATLLAYDGSADQASTIVRAGQGGLVTSVYSDDRKFSAAMIDGIAAWHGRIFLCDKKIAEKVPGPGTVLPSLLHGGPGRAGNGEELGGVRGLELYQHRTALQGNAPLLARYVGG